MHRLLALAIWCLLATQAWAVDTVIFLTSGTTWTVPSDWSSTNKIECWGAGSGGSGRPSNSGGLGAGGGGGGAYGSISNVSAATLGGTGASLSIGVGTSGTAGTAGATANGGVGGDTWFNASSLANAATQGVTKACGAQGGQAPGAGVAGNAYQGGVGGASASSTGTTKFSGGNGASGTNFGSDVGGGGGAAGLSGAGGNGVANANAGGAGGGGGGGGDNGANATAGTNPTGATGGNSGPGGTGGAGGTAGNPGTAGTNGAGGGGGGSFTGIGNGSIGGGGGAGTERTSNPGGASAGAGGGGGGGGNASAALTAGAGAAGGLYGGGGGAGASVSGAATGANGAAGAQGIIVITYTPAAGGIAKNNMLMGISYDTDEPVLLDPISLRFHGTQPSTGTIPTVSAASFYTYSPAISTQAVGTVFALCGGAACSGGNAITGWTITGGNSAGDFAISSAGAITVTAQGQTDLVGTTPLVSFTLTVTATNAVGTSAGESVPISVYADGFAGAATATIQQASLLNTYHAGGASNARAKNNGYQPAWNVAGVDYGTGIPTAQSLTDWQSLGSSIPGFTCNSGTGQCTATCSSGAVTVTGYDFTLHGGAYIVNTTNNCNVTVTNSKFGNTPTATAYTIHIQTTNANLTLKNCDFTGGNSTYGAFIGFQATGTVTLTYNYFHQGSQHVFEQVSGVMTLVDKFNFVYDMATLALAHNNWAQFGTIGSGSTAEIAFNGAYNDTVPAGNAAGEGWQEYANNSGTLTTGILRYNTAVAAKSSGSNTMSYINHGGTVGTGTNVANYFDISGAIGAYYPNSTTAAQGWSTILGNTNMVTGATITP